MKKSVITLLVGCFLLVGCGDSEEKHKEVLKGYAQTYYNKYMSGVDNQAQAEITINMLKVANEYSEDFDLSKLEGCTDDTNIIINLDENKMPISYEFELKCN